MSALDLGISQEPAALQGLNQHLATLSAEQRVAWALHHLPGSHVLSSSFGAQAAVALHLVTSQQPGLPVILIDTGYLFPETLAFVEQLRRRLDLNLHTWKPLRQQAWSRDAVLRLAEAGVPALERYNRVHKVEPMQRALQALDAQCWIAGLRRSQSRSRAELPILTRQQGRWKLHPLADWTDRDIGRYLRQHQLPYHPLWDQGYVSIGDWHSTRPLSEGLDAEDTRFFGLKRECGLHELSA